jgi:FkbH-like protein
VVSAAGDPAHLTGALLRRGWFDVLDLTDTDRDRPELYRARSMRTAHSTEFSTTEDYLQSLAIEVSAQPATAYTVPRAAQLAARTNQFNLTGIRFDAATTGAMAAEGHLVATFAVADRFGDEGIVGAAWVAAAPQAWHVDNLVLSCRVLGRGIEFAVVEWIARRAAAAGATRLTARFVHTGRNGAADGFLEKAGFTPSDGDGRYAVELTARPDALPTWIRLREDEG